MKKIALCFILFFLMMNFSSAYWEGKYFVDLKSKCVYGFKVDDMGRTVTQKVCYVEQSEAKTGAKK